MDNFQETQAQQNNTGNIGNVPMGLPPMSAPPKRSRKIWLWTAVVVLGVAAVGAIIIYNYFRKSVNNPPAETSQQLKQEPKRENRLQITQVDKNTIPHNFPKDIPWEQGAQIISNQQTYDTLIKTTSVDRIYVTSKTIQENLDIFNQYLKSGSWQHITAQGDSKRKVLSADKGISTYIAFALDYSGTDGKNTVAVMYLVK